VLREAWRTFHAITASTKDFPNWLKNVVNTSENSCEEFFAEIVQNFLERYDEWRKKKAKSCQNIFPTCDSKPYAKRDETRQNFSQHFPHQKRKTVKQTKRKTVMWIVQNDGGYEIKINVC
jgi:hypothetical protein